MASDPTSLLALLEGLRREHTSSCGSQAKCAGCLGSGRFYSAGDSCDCPELAAALRLATAQAKAGAGVVEAARALLETVTSYEGLFQGWTCVRWDAVDRLRVAVRALPEGA